MDLRLMVFVPVFVPCSKTPLESHVILYVTRVLTTRPRQRQQASIPCLFFNMSGEKKRPPGKRCVVMFCNKTNNDKVSLHQFPKEPTLRRQWISFVLTKRDDKTWTPGTGHICSSHFTEDDYESYGSKLAGFSTKLVLKKGSFPTVQPIPTTEQLVKAKNKRALQLRKRPCTSTRTNTKTSSSAPKRQSRALSKLTCNRVGIISHFNCKTWRCFPVCSSM